MLLRECASLIKMKKNLEYKRKIVRILGPNKEDNEYTALIKHEIINLMGEDIISFIKI